MKFVFLLFVTVTCLCACQREPSFFEPNPQTADSTNTNTAMKAIVFDGILSPNLPSFNYDSLVFAIDTFAATVTHYAKNGGVMWREILNYDNSGRVTNYRVDYIPGINYRHTWYTYSGVDSFPAGIIDSLNDSELIIMKISRTAQQTSSAGTVLTFAREYSVPGTGHSELYNIKYTFSTSGEIRSIINEGFYADIQEHFLYNAAGVLDSSYTWQVTLSGADTSGLKVLYSPTNSPLAASGKALYKNLYAFHPFVIGPYSAHLTLWFEPAAFFAPKLPLTIKQHNTSGTLDMSHTYNFILQGTMLKSATIQSYDRWATPMTTTTNVRFY